MSLEIAIYLILFNKKVISPALIMYTPCQQHQYIILSLNFTWCPGWSLKRSNCHWSSWKLSSWDAADLNQGGNQLWQGDRDKEIQCLGWLPGSPLLIRVQKAQNSCPESCSRHRLQAGDWSSVFKSLVTLGFLCDREMPPESSTPSLRTILNTYLHVFVLLVLKFMLFE